MKDYAFWLQIIEQMIIEKLVLTRDVSKINNFLQNSQIRKLIDNNDYISVIGDSIFHSVQKHVVMLMEELETGLYNKLLIPDPEWDRMKKLNGITVREPEYVVYERFIENRIKEIYSHLSMYIMITYIVNSYKDELLKEIDQTVVEKRYQSRKEETYGGYYLENPIEEICTLHVHRKPLKKNKPNTYRYIAEYGFDNENRLAERISWNSYEQIENRTIYLWMEDDIVAIFLDECANIYRINWRVFHNGLLNSYETLEFPYHFWKFQFTSVDLKFQEDSISEIITETLLSIDNNEQILRIDPLYLPFVKKYSKDWKKFKLDHNREISCTLYKEIYKGLLHENRTEIVIPKKMQKELDLKNSRWGKPILKD